MNKYFLHILLAVLFATSLSACASKKKVGDAASTTPIESAEVADDAATTLYEAGMNALAKGRYKTAIKNFEEIQRLYPYSKLSASSEIMTGFANYKNGDYDDAEDILRGFIRLNPGHKEIAYAYYLRALCFYDRIGDVKLDQAITQEAMEALGEVVNRFPNTDYARDARLKLDLVTDHLAGKQMEIGRYYLKQKNYNGALGRFQNVVKDYQTTAHIEEALYRITEIYMMMGIEAEAKKHAAILGQNYPDSKWYHYAYSLISTGKPSAKSFEKTAIGKMKGGSSDLANKVLGLFKK